ncbi:MAG TPA: sigma-70 family RNA polymerase sigma factor [Chloroflexota bacterium]|nr:sigma-70 family RNA polymerase sigma factor [Chloroflexota bacterium]
MPSRAVPLTRSPEPGVAPEIVEEAARDERRSLLRYCTWLTGDPDAAEDLVQQTLLAAWRHESALREPGARRAWLLQIARNTCLSWARGRARRGRVVRLAEAGLEERRPEGTGGQGAVLRATAIAPGWPAADFDVEVELERRELAELLDRAMAGLPPETRRVLLERYVEAMPQAEVAARLGLSEGAVEARLHRGKLALRRALAGPLRDEAAAFGLFVPAAAAWQTTNIWCPTCGRRRLLGRFSDAGELQLDCVDCWGLPRSTFSRWGSAAQFQGIKGFKPAFKRQMAGIHERLKHGVTGRTARCPRCGGEAPLYTDLDRGTGGWYYAGADCPRCGRVLEHTSIVGLALALPQGRRFWRAHPKLRVLEPTRVVEAEGSPALVTGYESVDGGARLEAVFVRETFELIRVHVHGHPSPGDG